MEPNTSTRLRFLNLVSRRLALRGLNVDDWFWYHPHEETLDVTDPAVFDQMDLHGRQEWLREALHEADETPAPDFDSQVLPYLREGYIIVRVGGLGSHLVNARPFQELDALNQGGDTWVFDLPYGNTLAPTEDCLNEAMNQCRGLSDVLNAGGRRIIFFAHSRGANVSLDLAQDPRFEPLGQHVAAIVSFAGAIGGSPAANGTLADKVKAMHNFEGAIQGLLGRIQRFVPESVGREPLWHEIPSLAALPRGLEDLTPEARRERLSQVNWDAATFHLFSVGAIPVPGQPRPLERILGRDLMRGLIDMAGYDLSQLNVLNDTQVMLNAAKWPPEAHADHLATVRADHWGVAYERLVAIMPPDPTPRMALYEAVLTSVYEKMKNRSGQSVAGGGAEKTRD